MYYVILKDKAVGPFLTREEAYSWGAAKADQSKLQPYSYAVKSDRVCQQEYLHLPIVKP